MNVTSLLEPQLRAMGRRLREERLARDINPRALEPDLRTTHRHLLAIEEGQTRLFYSESFFCDLVTRYALALGFSPEEAQEMVVTLRTPIPPVAAPAAAPLAEADVTAASAPADSSDPAAGQDPAVTADSAEIASAPASDPDTQAVAQEAAAEDPTPNAQPPGNAPKDVPQKSSFSTLFFVFLVAVVLVFWLVSQEDEAALAPASVLVTESAPKPAADSDIAPPVPAPVAPAPPAPNADAGLKPAVASPPAPLVSTTASPASASAATTANEPTGSPELELTFRTRGWVWVREANDSVREFVVPEGGTVRFQEMPIFIVLPAPDQIDARVSGRSIGLRRTEEDKNHGRYTRTMLRQAANLGRSPSPAAN